MKGFTLLELPDKVQSLWNLIPKEAFHSATLWAEDKSQEIYLKRPFLDDRSIPKEKMFCVFDQRI